MRLIIAIVRDTDGEEILQALIKAECRVTRIASRGGFLRHSNATLLIGVEPERVNEVIHLVREYSAPPVDPGLKRVTIFVLKVDRFEQI
jgi:uncharacterized protein YaaQ